MVLGIIGVFFAHAFFYLSQVSAILERGRHIQIRVWCLSAQQRHRNGGFALFKIGKRTQLLSTANVGARSACFGYATHTS